MPSEGREGTDVTGLLRRWREGDALALEELVETIEPELRRIARSRLAGVRARLGRRGGPRTLDTDALIQEVYVRFLQNVGSWQDRAHFFAVAALRMRSICVDHARRSLASKRSGGLRTELDAEIADIGGELDRIDVLALEQALERLAAMSPRQARIVTHRFYGGLGEEEVAEVESISVATARRDWAAARTWLYRELSPRTAT